MEINTLTRYEMIELIRMYGRMLSNALLTDINPESMINQAQRIVELSNALAASRNAELARKK